MIVHEETRKGYTIEIRHDTDPQNPRTEWDNLGTMYSAWTEGNMSDIDQGSAEDTEDWLDANNYIYLRLYGYQHGGRSVSTSPFSCKWDSGLLGYIAVTKKKVRKEYGWTNITHKRLKQVETWLEGEVDAFNTFLSGEIYAYEVKDDKGEHVDSCYGYYGDYDNKDYGALSEGRALVDYLVKKSISKTIHRLKQMIKYKCPLYLRQQFVCQQ